jgi:hypothetical protein
VILMREAWSALGGELSDLDRVKVEGDPAGLATRTLAAWGQMCCDWMPR